MIATAVGRPVATTLLSLGVALAGCVAFRYLQVSPLPQVDFPVIQVQASMAGASPETMAATVATPLERRLGQIAGLTAMRSTNSLGATEVDLQFDLDRDINGAARDVQAAINAARSDLPVNLRSLPTYKKEDKVADKAPRPAQASTTHPPSKSSRSGSFILGRSAISGGPISTRSAGSTWSRSSAPRSRPRT